MKTLKQKIGFKSVTYTIVDTGLIRNIQSKSDGSEFHFPFEQIKTNKATITEQNKGALAVAGVFAAIALFVFVLNFSDKTVDPIAVPLWLSISLIGFFYYFRTRVKKVYLQTTENVKLEFLANKPSIEDVEQFIQQILKERNGYLLSKYGQLTRNLEFATQFDNLNWLLNNRVLTKQGYDDKIQELNKLFNPNLGSKPIGFSTSN
ncbi:MAG TPA: hypothetical protein VFN30_13530 [Chitinophagaceae bacterium]|nr:hypothetical protein [Chitinophagaceae bacterium]